PAVTGIVFGLAPVLRVGGSRDLDGLREGARSGGGLKDRVRSALVIAEIIASVVLLVSAGLLLRALLAVQAVDPDFRPDGVLTMRTELSLPRIRSGISREAFYRRVLEDVRAVPGVNNAAYTTSLPMSFRGGIFPVAVS